MTPTTTKLLTLLGPRYSSASTLLVALLGAWGAKLDQCRVDEDAALAQLSILTASSLWLDQWGLLYGVLRLSGEDDDSYALRIIQRTIMQRPQALALEQIILGAFTLAAFYVRDLWPFVLLSDQWTTLSGRPLQVSDGQLQTGFLSFGPNSASLSFSSLFSPGSFGIWVSERTTQLLSYTLNQVLTLLPLELISDQFGSLNQLSDGQLTTPNFGGPLDTARHSFNLPVPTFPVPIADLLDLLNQHRAAGTKVVVMGTELQSG